MEEQTDVEAPVDEAAPESIDGAATSEETADEADEADEAQAEVAEGNSNGVEDF